MSEGTISDVTAPLRCVREVFTDVLFLCKILNTFSSTYARWAQKRDSFISALIFSTPIRCGAVLQLRQQNP